MADLASPFIIQPTSAGVVVAAAATEIPVQGGVASSTARNEEKEDYGPHPATARWIEENLVYGDSHHHFLDKIDRSAVRKATVDAAGHLFAYLNPAKADAGGAGAAGGYEPEPDISGIYRMVILIAPWPGFVKSAMRLGDIDDDMVQYDDLWIANEQDGGRPASLYRDLWNKC